MSCLFFPLAFHIHLYPCEQHRSGGGAPGYNASLSYSSSCVSATEFFDAEDLPLEKGPPPYQQDANEEESEVRTRSESSSEAGSLSSGEGSVSSEESELLGNELKLANDLDLGGKFFFVDVFFFCFNLKSFIYNLVHFHCGFLH